MESKMYLDSVVTRSREEEISGTSRAPDRTVMSDKRSLTFEHVLLYVTNQTQLMCLCKQDITDDFNNEHHISMHEPNHICKLIHEKLNAFALEN